MTQSCLTIKQFVLRFPNNNHENDALIQMLQIIMDSLPKVDENKAVRESHRDATIDPRRACFRLSGGPFADLSLDWVRVIVANKK